MITELGGVNHKSVVAGFMFGDSNNLSVSVIGRTGYLMKREREREGYMQIKLIQSHTLAVTALLIVLISQAVPLIYFAL